MPNNPNDEVGLYQADGGHAHASDALIHAEDSGYPRDASTPPA